MTRLWPFILTGFAAVAVGVAAIWLLVSTVIAPSPGWWPFLAPDPAPTEEVATEPAPDPQPAPTGAPTPTPTPTPDETEDPEDGGEDDDEDADPTPSPTPTTPPPPQHAPVAVDDVIVFDLRSTPTTVSGDVLANDSDADGDALAAVPASGAFTLDGDGTTAGTYSLAADGTLTLVADPDPFGPLPLLGDGEAATVTLTYTVTDGARTDSGRVEVQVTGRLDPFVAMDPILGVEDGCVLDHDAETATEFDASAVFRSPDGGLVDITWSATSSGDIPAIFDGGEPAGPTISVFNSEWGAFATVTLTAIATPRDGRPVVTQSVSFTVSAPTGP